mmetsp:Transcript_4608/g.16495  ORF Transcript_4608/g.16495 Transcript_4608/m.16495 type:complete len:145 (+) Transcript_4608:694-1128(+)
MDTMDDAFDIIGITEDFDSFLVMVALKMGWPLQDMVYSKQKVIADRPRLKQLKNAHLTELYSLYKEELVLYSYARLKFERLKRETPYFAEVLRGFRHLQAAHEESARPEVLHIDPEAGILPGQLDRAHSLAVDQWRAARNGTFP